MNYIMPVFCSNSRFLGDQVTKVQVLGSLSKIESITKMHKGVIMQAATLSKSSTSFEITHNPRPVATVPVHYEYLHAAVILYLYMVSLYCFRITNYN